MVFDTITINSNGILIIKFGKNNPRSPLKFETTKYLHLPIVYYVMQYTTNENVGSRIFYFQSV